MSTSTRRNRVAVAVAAVLVTALIAAGCSDSSEKFSEVGSAVNGGGADHSGDGDGESESDSADAATAEPGSPTDEGSRSAEEYALDDAAADTSESDPLPPGGPIEQPSTLLNAGSIDDNELWDEYLLYREEFLASGIPVSDIDVSGRQILEVVDSDGDPVLGARITITDDEGDTVANLTTFADGRAVFHGTTDVDPTTQRRVTYTAEVVRGVVSTTVDLTPGALSQEISLDADLSSDANLDVLFLIDSTGSMSDEIEQLKANMISVSEQIGELPSQPTVRFGMVVYRDVGDEYVSQTYDFTDDVDAFSADLAEVVADGGGDTPEALGSGLNDAVNGVAWTSEDAVKLVFLVADAAPHLAGEPGYESEPDYAVDLVTAAAQGIKVFPIASSGLDPQGEFVFRQLAQVTMGRFMFLTYGADGVSPGDSTPHQVDPEDYSVLALDQLVVQLVTDELAHLE